MVGINIYSDYGISWDEAIQRRYGGEVYEYVFNGNEKLLKSKERYYGPTFEVFLVVAEKALDLTDLRDVYLTRHLLTFLLFFVSSIMFYKTLLIRYKNVFLSLLGTLMLVSSPRIFAHSFYNSKDLVFLSAYVISSYTFFRYFDNKNKVNLLLHVVASSFAITTRIAGVIVPLITLVVMLIDFLNSKKADYSLKKYIFASLLYIVTLFFFVTLFWPSLWPSPLKYFIEAFNEARNFPHEGSVLYFGRYIKSTKLPWHYLPVWILITTPLMYSLLSIAGFVTAFKKIKFLNKFDFYSLGWFFIPFTSVLILKPVMYDSWRQVFFIYPAMIYFGVFALSKIRESKRLFNLIKLLLLAAVVTSGVAIYKGHPLQDTYFNLLVSNMPANEIFAYDYWGLSYYQGLKFIVENDSRNKITISVENFPGISNAYLLNMTDRNRVEVVEDVGTADYYLTNYRDKGQYQTKLLYNEYSYISTYGKKALGIYKSKTNNN